MKICPMCDVWSSCTNDICDDCEQSRKKVLIDYIKQLELAKGHKQSLFIIMLNNGRKIQ